MIIFLNSIFSFSPQLTILRALPDWLALVTWCWSLDQKEIKIIFTAWREPKKLSWGTWNPSLRSSRRCAFKGTNGFSFFRHHLNCMLSWQRTCACGSLRYSYSHAVIYYSAMNIWSLYVKWGIWVYAAPALDGKLGHTGQLICGMGG